MTEFSDELEILKVIAHLREKFWPEDAAMTDAEWLMTWDFEEPTEEEDPDDGGDGEEVDEDPVDEETHTEGDDGE